MKLVIIFFLFFSLSYAEKFVLEVENTNDYIKADVFFKTKEYKKAYDLYYSLFEKYPQNINVNYFLALSAMQIKDFSSSMGAIERVLIQKPNLFIARFLQIKILYYVNMKDEALSELQKLQKNLLNKKEELQVQNFINFIKKEKKTFALNAIVLLGLSSSDNVNNGPKQKFFLPDFFGSLEQGDDKKSDYAPVQLIKVDLINSFKNISSINLKNSLIYYNKSYKKEKKSDFKLYSYNSSINYFNNQAIYTLNAAIARYIPGKEKDDIFESLGIDLKYKQNTYSLQAFYNKYQYKEKINKDKNSSKYQLQYSYFNFYNILYKLDLTKVSKNNSTRVDIDRNSIKNSFTYKYLVNNKNILNFTYANTLLKYEDESPAFLSKRKDVKNEFKISYTKLLDKKNILMFNLSHNDNNSNHAKYKYNKNTLDISYIYRFSY